MSFTKFTAALPALLLFSWLPAGFCLHPAWTRANLLTVPEDFHSVQEAINNAREGDFVFIRSGTYFESVIVNKTVTLIGESKETTIINGNRSSTVLSVTANNVTISNLTITGSKRDLYNACGIYTNSSNTILFNTTITDNNWGTYFEKAHNSNVTSNLISNSSMGCYMTDATNTFFEKNHLTGNGIGVYSLWSYDSLFNENTVEKNTGSAFTILHGYFCTIKQNTIIENGCGLWLDPLLNSSIIENSIINNTQVGIRFHGYSYDNVIVRNAIVGSEEGFLFHDTSRTSIIGNAISENERGLAIHGGSSIALNLTIQRNSFFNNTIGLWQSGYNWGLVSQNNFINNDAQAKNENPSYVHWDNAYPSGGNYWANYVGTDLFRGPNQNIAGSDGIGDTPYTIDEFTQDNYPFMAPVTTFNAGTWFGVSYVVLVVSNSGLSDFQVEPSPMEPSVGFNVTGEGSTMGFCRVAIPCGLLWVDDGWKIAVGDVQIPNYGLEQDENNAYVYFTYIQNMKRVKITGTHIIPELHSITLLFPAAVLSVLITIAVGRRRLLRVQASNTDYKRR